MSQRKYGSLTYVKILHGTWIPKNGDGFITTGAFYLWLESDISGQKNAAVKKHPPKVSQLIDFIKNELGLLTDVSDKLLMDNNISDKYFFLPSANDQPLHSLEYMKYLGNDIPDKYTLKQWEISCLKIDNVIKFLKELHFISLYKTEEFKLDKDLLFWYHYTAAFKEVLLKDQYIPALKYRETKKTPKSKKPPNYEIYPGWEIISDQYESNIKKYISYMPVVCTACSDIPTKGIRFYSKETLLRHFSENILHEIVQNTQYTEKIRSQVADTFLHNCLRTFNADRLSNQNITLEEYKKWLDWKDRLTIVSSKTNFHLCFKLTDPPMDDEKWQIEFIVASKLDPSLKMSLSDYWNLDGKAKNAAIEHFGGKDFERLLLLNLGYAARMYSVIWDGMEIDTPTGISVDTYEAYRFLKESAWILEDAGYKIIVPSWWTPQGRRRAKVRLKTSLTASTSAQSAKAYLSFDSIIGYRYELSIGDEIVSKDEWNRLMDMKSPLVNFRGEWIELDKDKMKQMLDFWQSQDDKQSKLSLIDIMKMTSESENEVELDHEDAMSEILSNLYEKSRLKEAQTPAAFNGTLRPYQLRGLSWLQYLEFLGLNPCLADDMGLGKTIQVIAKILTDKEKGQTLPDLLIAPTSVIGNWEREIERFAPTLKALVHHGAERIKDEKQFKDEYLKYDIIITSFALARRDVKLFGSLQWKHIIIDEAQNIKNPKAEQTKAILKLKSSHRIALTGTPIENRLLDLWSILNFLNPGYLGTMALFRNKFELPIQKENDINRSNVLKKLVEPFILRRLKTDTNIIKDLPDKMEQKVYCNLTKEQASLYEAVVKDVEEQLKEKDGIARKGLILSTLMKLKQICNHPMQFLQDGGAFTAQRSFKLKRLSEMVEEIIENGESLLIFSQFAELCAALSSFIKNTLHYNTYYIHGGTVREKREHMIAEFQAEQTEPSVFILSLKAGGVGITLTKANHVFHFDRWWNPAVEDQATDRAFRIGQTKNVFVHKYISIGTLEEKIDAIIEEKKHLSSSIIGADESWLTELDNESFKKLIELSKDAVMDEV